MKVLIDRETLFGNNVKLIEKVQKREAGDDFPEKLKWAIQTIYRQDETWIEICRIDNYMHENMVGSHIHLYGSDVKRMAIEYREARRLTKELTERVLRKELGFFIDMGLD